MAMAKWARHLQALLNPLQTPPRHHRVKSVITRRRARLRAVSTRMRLCNSTPPTPMRYSWIKMSTVLPLSRLESRKVRLMTILEHETSQGSFKVSI